MANNIEVREALESHETDDVKVKKIVEVLYYLQKKNTTPTIAEFRPPPFPPHLERNPFHFSQLPGNVSHSRAETVVSKLRKVFTWGRDNELFHKGRLIKDSNVMDLVKYLIRRGSSI